MSISKSKFTSAETAAAETIEESKAAVTHGFDKTLHSMKEGIEKATKGFETSQAKMKEGVAKAMKTAEEMVAFSQGNIEAMMKASQIFASGFQEISKHVAASSKASIDESMAFSKSLISVKSVKEALEMQSGFARSAIEKAVAESSKLTDETVKLTENAIAPLTARLALAVETFGKTS